MARNQPEAAGDTASWKAFRKELRQSDAVLFITPEYNRSVPGVLKNAIDVGSRPYGSSSWAGKPAAIISLSPGAMSASSSAKRSTIMSRASRASALTGTS